MTSIPGFYEPMGFKIVPQFAYVGDAPTALPPLPRCRRLDLDAGEDRQLLAKLLRRRPSLDALRGGWLIGRFRAQPPSSD
jgi:hypothetical protein